MRRTLWTGILLILASGCTSTYALDWPELPGFGAPAVEEANPLYVPLSGPQGYSTVFETAMKALYDSGFEVIDPNRLDGHIDTLPRVAPGIGLPLKAGSPVLYERWLATLQSYRHRAHVQIHPAQNGGFFVQVIVFKELEDLPRPVRATTGAVILLNENDVGRHFEVIDPTVFESNWIPRGRDIPVEQSILRRIKSCL